MRGNLTWKTSTEIPGSRYARLSKQWASDLYVNLLNPYWIEYINFYRHQEQEVPVELVFYKIN